MITFKAILWVLLIFSSVEAFASTYGAINNKLFNLEIWLLRVKQFKNKRTYLICKIFLLIKLLLFTNLNFAEATPIKLGIFDFEVKTSSISQLNHTEFSEKVSDIFIGIIKNSSQQFQIIDCRNSNSSEKCDYILFGTVTDIKIDSQSSNENKVKGGLFNSKIDVKTTFLNTYEVILNARIVNIKTGEVISSITKSGVAEDKFSVIFELAATNQKAFEEITERYNKMSLHAIKAACSGLSNKILEIFTKEYVLVDVVEKNSVIINRGFDAGVELEDFYRIFSEGEEIFDLDGKSLGRDDFNIAVVKVKRVYDNFCSCEIISGKASSIQRGDRAEIITPSEADKLSNGKSKNSQQAQTKKSKTKTSRKSKNNY